MLSEVKRDGKGLPSDNLMEKISDDTFLEIKIWVQLLNFPDFNRGISDGKFRGKDNNSGQ